MSCHKCYRNSKPLYEFFPVKQTFFSISQNEKELHTKKYAFFFIFDYINLNMSILQIQILTTSTETYNINNEIFHKTYVLQKNINR